MKKMTAIVLIIMFFVTCININILADGEAITIEIEGLPYSENTLPGTSINTKSTAALNPGQKIAYFHNDEKVGESSVAGSFNFTSVEGENKIQAKIMSGDNVLAESNVITLDFPLLRKGRVIKSSPLSSVDNSKIFENGFLSSGWASFTDDPAGTGAEKVLRVKEPTPAAPAVTLPFASFSGGESISVSGVVRADFEFYASHFQGTVYSTYIGVNCGCYHSRAGYADWPSGKATNASRNYTYPKGKWLKMSIVVDNRSKTYDIYADGIQIVSSNPFCNNESHSEANLTSINFPCPGWAGTVKLYDEEGNPIYEEDGVTQKTEKHHGEFYLKNFEYYEVIPDYISVTTPSTVVAGNNYYVNVNKKTDREMKFIYNVNGVDSEPTDATRYSCFAKSGDNTIVVKVTDNDEIISTSETVHVTGYFASPDKGFTMPLVGAELTVTENSKYNIMDMSQNYPDHGEVAVFEVGNGSKSIYPQHGITPFKTSGRGFHTTSYASDSEVYTYSYDVNIQRLDGSASLAFNHYYPGGEKFPTVFAFDKNGNLTVGVGKNTSKIPFDKNKWINLKIILLKSAKTAYFLVDDVLVESSLFTEFPGHEVLFDNAVKFCYFSSSTNNGKNIIYVDNYYLGYGKLQKFSLQHNLKNHFVPCTSKVRLNVVNPYNHGFVNYYHNNVLVIRNSCKSSVDISLYPGENTLYAELFADGEVIDKTTPVIINAYADEFVDVYKASGSTSVFALHQKHKNDVYGINEFLDDSEKFLSDSCHGQVLRISSSVANSDEYQPHINILSSTRNYYNIMKNAKRLYSVSIDVYPESIISGNLDIVNASSTYSSNEKYFSFFRFDSGNLYVSETLGENSSDFIKIPCENKWYSLKVIYNPIECTYTLLVDDVIYSIVSVENKNHAPRFFDSESLLYYDITLSGSKSENNPNVVYLDNYVMAYSELPEAHTEFVYATNTEYITSLSQISDSDKLTVSFVATKGKYDNILCIASVLEKGGKLKKIATREVTFENSEDSEFVTLELDELPRNIADGDYSINVMLWDANSMKPIVAKTVFGN